MGKKIDCSKVNPASGCGHVVRGKDVEEVLKKAAAHAEDHGMKPTQELLDKVKSFIENE